MFNFKALKSTVATFAQDRGGNFAIMFALCSIPLLMGVGIAVDFTRMLNAKSDMQNALDIALMSTTKNIAQGKIQASDAQSAVTKFFEANLNARRYDVGSVTFKSFNFDPKTVKISASVQTNLPLAFPVFGTGKTAKVETSSVASFVERKVEVAMVLDVTGSMGGQKINELKTAAKAGVKEFLDSGYGNTRVAVVPYAMGVNAGAFKPYVVNEAGLPAKDACATDRRGVNAFTDTSPVSSKITRADRMKYWYYNDGKLVNDTSDFYFDLPMDWKFYNKKRGADCPDVAVQPLTTSSTTLNSMIDKLKADGGTAGQIGLQWGWYMISPNWKSVFSSAAKPVDYGTPNVEKIIILMTDGVFNSEASDLSNAAIPAVAGIANPSGRLAMQSCDNIKAKGVKIYTIGFRLKEIESAVEEKEAMRLLNDCASTPVGGETTFFDAQNGAQLTAAFKEIAKRVEVVALTN